MRNTLVTGGAGFIGSHLVEALLAAGDHVVVLDDLSTGTMENLEMVKDHPRLRVLVDTVTDEALMRDLIENADEIYHLAAVVGVRLVLEEAERMVAVNTEATTMILRLAAARSRRIFMASSSEVYGKNPKSPLSEDDDVVLGPSPKGRWLYGCGKAHDDYLALSLHRREGLPVVIGRFFNTVGPRQVGQYGMVVPRFVEQALNGGPLEVHGDGKQVRCFSHVMDVVRGLLALMTCPDAAGQVFNIGNDEPISIRGLAEKVVGLIDPSVPIEYVPYAEVFGSDFEDIPRRVPDLTRIRETVGYRPHFRLRDILLHVIAWKKQAVSREPEVSALRI